MQPVILFRPDINTESEYAICQQYCPTYVSRMHIPYYTTVIGRYCVLPFYDELYADLATRNCVLINTPQQHNYLADLQQWYQDLSDFTPKSWFTLQELPPIGPFVVKGQTNSRKFQWDTHMFAATKPQAINIAVELQNDSLLQYQNIYVRQYVPLQNYGYAIHGLPITHEFRFFVLYGQILSGGYYWSNHIDDLPIKPDPNTVPKTWLQNIVAKIGTKANFYTIDVALTQSGEWIVIELNDGQMSGLSENDPNILYRNIITAFPK